MRESEEQFKHQGSPDTESFSRAQTYLSLKREGLQTRTEHSRSMEDAEKYKALETLKDLGVLIPLGELEVYHGRAAHPDTAEEWEVNPAFGNGGNQTGHNNVYDRSTLYAGDQGVATDFAVARMRQKGLDSHRPNLHRIESHDMDAMIFDKNFEISALNSEQRQQYRQALDKLLLFTTEGSPLNFEDRYAWDKLAPYVAALGERKFLSDADVEQLITQSGFKREVILQLAGSINVRQMASFDPGYLINRLLNSAEDLSHGQVWLADRMVGLPLNLEYLQKYLHEAHIVGVQEPVYSATLKKEINIISFFDLDEVKTSATKDRERAESWWQLGGLAQAFDSLTSYEAGGRNPVLARLSDAHAKPEEIVEAARKIVGYEQIFAGSTGAWEGFTLGEHTETVLRNFDETYADIMPVSLLAPMRLAILTHDIGKNSAVARLDKREQASANLRQALDFMNKLGVDRRYQDVIASMVGLGADLAYLIDVKKISPTAKTTAKQAMFQLAQGTMREFLGRDPSTEEMRAFVVMCQILQRCDGGAYTSMAVTRPESGGSYYRNAPSFNESFAQPVDISRRKVVLRSVSQPPAASRLAPDKIKPIPPAGKRPGGITK